jgi:DNA-3-methyladenine glycosylase
MIYGMYYCLNITTGPPGIPEVVLLRAVEPASGLELMRRRRRTDKPAQLASGPGKLCGAMDIGKTLYGADLVTSRELYLEYGEAPAGVTASSRIGIDYAVLTRDEPWRFFVTGSGFVSRPAQGVSKIQHFDK